jgi:hypothetical protein
MPEDEEKLLFDLRYAVVSAPEWLQALAELRKTKGNKFN